MNITNIRWIETYTVTFKLIIASFYFYCFFLCTLNSFYVFLKLCTFSFIIVKYILLAELVDNINCTDLCKLSRMLLWLSDFLSMYLWLYESLLYCLYRPLFKSIVTSRKLINLALISVEILRLLSLKDLVRSFLYRSAYLGLNLRISIPSSLYIPLFYFYIRFKSQSPDQQYPYKFKGLRRIMCSHGYANVQLFLLVHRLPW